MIELLHVLVSIITSPAFSEVLMSLASWLHSDTENEFREIKLELENMKAFLEDVEDCKTQITDNKLMKSIMTWEMQVRRDAYKVEDLINEYQILAQSRSSGGVAGSSHNFFHYGFDATTKHKLATKVRTVKVDIQKTAYRRHQYNLPSTSIRSIRDNNSELSREVSVPFQGDNLFGIEHHKDELLEWLLRDENQRMVISICGMAGLGKTTLVNEVYNHPKVKKFFEYRAWISVSQSYDLANILRDMEEQLQKQKSISSKKQQGQQYYRSKQTLVDNIINILSTNTYLIVLDDVWNLDVFTELKRYMPNHKFRSRIIFTTRDEALAKASSASNILKLRPLENNEARRLFFENTFRNGNCPRELEHWAGRIINKCKGLPLALVAIARVMSSKGTSVLDWESTLQRLDWELHNNDMLKEMSRALMLSYNYLPHHLKRCFLYCSLLPEDYLIKTNWLVKLLIAEGFIEEQGDQGMEDIARDYIFRLCDKSMLQVVKKDESGRVRSFRVHDLMRDLAFEASKGLNLCIKSSEKLAIIDEYCRRVSISGKIDRIKSNEHHASLRTLLVFTHDPSCIQNISSGLKLLRVLELRGAPIETLPKDVFKLHNLRYLGLRETNVSVIPDTVENLYNLQTLDLWKTKVTEVPREILKLKYLRHLFKDDINAEKLNYHNIGHLWRGDEALSNICELRNLQTLRTIRANDDLVSNIGNLTQLRSLGITMLNENHGNGLCNSLSRMNDLLRLSIKANDQAYGRQFLRLENLRPPPPSLQKLILNGLLKTVPTWFSDLRNLRHLYIFNSRLGEKDSPIPFLQDLPNLVVLALDDAYDGRFLSFASGKFQSLKKLSLSNLRALEKLNIENGTMRNLQKLRLYKFKHLNSVESIDHLTQLQDCCIRETPKLAPLRVNSRSISSCSTSME